MQTDNPVVWYVYGSSPKQVGMATHGSQSVSRKLAVVMLFGSLVLGFAGIASAEGSFSSAMSRVLTGYSSRTWVDKDLDATSTRIGLAVCRNAYSNAGVTPTLQLSQVRSLLPDINKGSKTYNCGSRGGYVNQYWGDVPAGTYRFTLVAVNGSAGYQDPINVSGVQVAY